MVSDALTAGEGGTAQTIRAPDSRRSFPGAVRGNSGPAGFAATLVIKTAGPRRAGPAWSSTASATTTAEPHLRSWGAFG